MMMKYSIFLLFIASALFVSDCKKRYPRDIPHWLKSKIKALEKETKDKGCRYDDCMYILEATDGSSTIYEWESGSTLDGVYIYDYDGNEVCPAMQYTHLPCGKFANLEDFHLVRFIWKERD